MPNAHLLHRRNQPPNSTISTTTASTYLLLRLVNDSPLLRSALPRLLSSQNPRKSLLRLLGPDGVQLPCRPMTSVHFAERHPPTVNALSQRLPLTETGNSGLTSRSRGSLRIRNNMLPPSLARSLKPLRLRLRFGGSPPPRLQALQLKPHIKKDLGG